MLLKLHVYFILIGERTLQMFVCLFSILNKKKYNFLSTNKGSKQSRNKNTHSLKTCHTNMIKKTTLFITIIFLVKQIIFKYVNYETQ